MNNNLKRYLQLIAIQDLAHLTKVPDEVTDLLLDDLDSAWLALTPENIANLDECLVMDYMNSPGYRAVVGYIAKINQDARKDYPDPFKE